MDKQNQFGCNRREFLKAAGIGAAVLAMPGLIRNTSAAPASSILQEVITTDVLVIGGGIAGTFAAVKAKENGADVTIVDKGTVGRSGLSPFFHSFACFNKSGSVTRQQYIEAVASSGKYLAYRDYMEMFMDDSADIGQEFLSWGADKPHTGGHGATFRGQILENDIRLIERTMITELFKKNGKIAGAIGFPMEEDKAVIIKAKAVVLCAGAGALKTPGFQCNNLTHDGDTMAYRVGAEVTGKEFCDFHWTHWENPADAYGNWGGVPSSDGVIGLREYRLGSVVPGAPDMPLQVHKGSVPYLVGGSTGGGGTGGSDERPTGGAREDAAGERPTGGAREDASGGRSSGGARGGASDERPTGSGADEPKSGGRDMKTPPGTRDASLPVVWGATAGMSAHKCEGVFPKDNKCASSVPGLFAAGDALFTSGAAYSGGGGSSSLGSATQGANAGKYAAQYAKENKQQKLSTAELTEAKTRVFAPRTSEKGFSPIWVTQVLQGIMVPYYVLNIKKQSRLKAALSNIEFLREQFAPNLLANDTHQLRLAHETKNMLLNSEMKLRSGLMRTESRGDHYREDYPDQDDRNWLAWVIISRDGDSMKLEKRSIPDAWKPKSAYWKDHQGNH